MVGDIMREMERVVQLIFLFAFFGFMTALGGIVYLAHQFFDWLF